MRALKPSEAWGPLNQEVTVDDYMSVTDVTNNGGIAMRVTNDYINDGSLPEGCTGTLDRRTPGDFMPAPYDYSSVMGESNAQNAATIPRNDYLNSQSDLRRADGMSNLAFVDTRDPRETYLEPAKTSRINQADDSAIPHNVEFEHDEDSKPDNLRVDDQPPRCPSGSADKGSDENNANELKPPPRPPRCSGASDKSVNIELIV